LSKTEVRLPLGGVKNSLLASSLVSEEEEAEVQTKGYEAITQGLPASKHGQDEKQEKKGPTRQTFERSDDFGLESSICQQFHQIVSGFLIRALRTFVRDRANTQEPTKALDLELLLFGQLGKKFTEGRSGKGK
jgi:hypothetical protein